MGADRVDNPVDDGEGVGMVRFTRVAEVDSGAAAERPRSSAVAAAVMRSSLAFLFRSRRPGGRVATDMGSSSGNTL